ncbi:MAG: hypothetical protein GX661_03750 [Acholeplasmataceae bacterium]|nr:hypothetical protein [Acholeplasmataceae bacterium]
MFKRLKIMALLQMSNKYKFKKPENAKRLLANIVLRIFGLIIITVLCAGLTMLLTDIIGIPKNVNLLTFIIVIMQIFSIISCLGGLMENLYNSKDNQILLSYPAQPIEVFISKLIVYYIYELIKSLYFFLPFFLGFGIILGLISPLYILATILMIILLPLFPVLIAALLSIPFLYLKRLLRIHPLVKTILGAGLMVGIFILIDYVLGFLPVPLRILAMYDVFIAKLKDFIFQINRYALYYKSISAIFFSTNIIQGYLLTIGILVLLALLIIFILRPFYFRMASRSSEHANLKTHQGKNTVHENTFVTFLKKEWLLATRAFSEFVNNYSFIIALPYILYIMLTIFASVDRNSLGDTMLATFSMAITLMMATASNTASAMAITSEGQEFVLLKTAPGKTSNLCWAKILFNLVFSTIVIIFSYLLFIFMTDRRIDVPALMLMMLASILINSGLIFWSFQIDLLNPKLSEYASTGTVAHGNNYSKSILIGFCWMVFFTLVFTLFFLDKSTTDATRNIKILGMAGGFFIARIYLFTKYLKAFFKEIEF